MIIKKRYVIDTNAIIFYFSDVFNQSNGLSKRARAIISDGFKKDSEINLIIPSIVFVEIYKKWCKSEELSSQIYYEVYSKVIQCDNIEIKPIEKVVLMNLTRIGGILDHHEINDKLILAAAIMLECPIITTDRKIKQFVDQTKIIPMAIL
jgi:PIN domain nuclease of toxin-antitoxin system